MDHDFESLCRTIDAKDRQLRELSEDHTATWQKWMEAGRVGRSWRSLSGILALTILVLSGVVFGTAWGRADLETMGRERAYLPAMTSHDAEYRDAVAERDHYRLAMMSALSLYEDQLRQRTAFPAVEGNGWDGFRYIFFGNGHRSIDLAVERRWAADQTSSPLIYFGATDPGLYIPARLDE